MHCFSPTLGSPSKGFLVFLPILTRLDGIFLIFFGRLRFFSVQSRPAGPSLHYCNLYRSSFEMIKTVVIGLSLSGTWDC